MTMTNLWSKDRVRQRELKKERKRNDGVDTEKVIGPNQKSHKRTDTHKKMKKKDFKKHHRICVYMSTFHAEIKRVPFISIFDFILTILFSLLDLISSRPFYSFVISVHFNFRVIH